jgi:pilus assembly protein CpaE
VKDPLAIMVAGRFKPALETLEQLLKQYGGVDLTIKLISNGHSDPLYNVRKLPEILIYVIGENDHEGMAALIARPPVERPHTIVVGPNGDVSQFRSAMRAGARDYLTMPVVLEELATALDQIAQELQSQRTRKTADLFVVMNAKGGSGASVISTNLACIDRMERKNKTLLVDMDLQFGSIPSYLNLTPNNGLIKAIEDIEHLDAVAVDGIVLKHDGGLRVLAASQEEIILNEEIPQSRIASLFKLLAETYDEVVVDMPRHIDTLSSLILQHADKIVLVMEASLAHVRDAKRMLQILQNNQGLPRERIQIVVNRYDKGGSVRLSDIQEALRCDDIFTLPSDFRRVNDSVNLGTPLIDFASNAPITKSMKNLAHSLRPEDQAMPSRRSKLLQWVRPSATR